MDWVQYRLESRPQRSLPTVLDIIQHGLLAFQGLANTKYGSVSTFILFERLEDKQNEWYHNQVSSKRVRIYFSFYTF